MRGFEVEELGVGDNMSGLVWVMEWRSVLVIILPIPKKKRKLANKIQENKEEEPLNKRSQYKVSCFIVLIVLKTN